MTATNPAVVGEREALLPCPFCGNSARVVLADDQKSVECGGCGAASCIGPEPQAVAAWNRRAPLRDAPPPTVGGVHGSVEGAASVTSETVTSSLSGGASVADLLREAEDYIHAVEVLFSVQPEGDCLAERKPTKDEAAYRAFVYLNDQGTRLREAIAALRAVGVAEQKGGGE